MLNLIIDLVSFLNLLALGFTAFIMRYVLPPGTGGRGRQLYGGRGVETLEDFWSMTRHQWGDIHFYLAVLFLLLMLVHIILHWNWLKNCAMSLLRLSKKQCT